MAERLLDYRFCWRSRWSTAASLKLTLPFRPHGCETHGKRFTQPVWPTLP